MTDKKMIEILISILIESEPTYICDELFMQCDTWCQKNCNNGKPDEKCIRQYITTQDKYY